MIRTLVASALGALALYHMERIRKSEQLVVPGGHLSSPFLVRRTQTHWHRGIDISAPRGSYVRAISSGVVIGLYDDCKRSGYGNCILVEHWDGTLGFYAHLQDFNVVKNQYVRKGDVIAFVGNTNCGIDDADGYMAPHLHLEVHGELVTGPSGYPQISENVPRRIDPVRYLRSVGMSPG
jgi:murein DD-endopeptidase MepM/ murein hydrolase activator NlpD